MERFKVRLPQTKNTITEESDLSISKGVTQTSDITPIDEQFVSINKSDVYNDERNESEYYMFHGDITVTASNQSFNVLPTFSSNIYKSLEDLNNSDIRGDVPNTGSRDLYETKLEDVIIENNGWFGYLTDEDPGFILDCKFNYFDPGPERFSIIKETGEKNWDIVLTYPYKNDYKISFQSGNQRVPLGDGLAIIGVSKVNFSGKKMVALHTPINHNLSIGDDINLYYNGEVKKYLVEGLGTDKGTLQNSVFIINDYNLYLLGLSSSNPMYFKRVIDDKESEYYVRKFQPIKNTYDEDDYDVFINQFNKNIFNDRKYSFNQNFDINLENIKDNLGRPLSEVYLTFIKNVDIISSGSTDPFWTAPLAGFLTNDIDTYRYLEEFENGTNINDKNTPNYNIRLIALESINNCNNEILPEDKSWLPSKDNDNFICDNGYVYDSVLDLCVNVSGMTHIPDFVNDVNLDMVDINNGYDITTITNNNLLLINDPCDPRFGSETITTNDGFFYGDIVEYSPATLLEYVLEDVYHRINTVERDSREGNEGYIYSPHKKIKIRDFSSNIEVADPLKTADVPEYAIYDGNTGNVIWRDFLTKGYIDESGNGVDYPFLNGKSYVYNIFNLSINRQDPYQDYKFTYGIDIDLDIYSDSGVFVDDFNSGNILGSDIDLYRKPLITPTNCFVYYITPNNIIFDEEIPPIDIC